MGGICGWKGFVWAALALGWWPQLRSLGGEAWACLAVALALAAWHGWDARRDREEGRRKARRMLRRAQDAADEALARVGQPPIRAGSGGRFRPRLRVFDPREA